MKIVKRMPKEAILACARWNALEPLLLPDNVIARCGLCGFAIQHRPHAPKKSRKVCMVCMEIDKDTVLMTTQRMIDDFKTYTKRQKQ